MCDDVINPTIRTRVSLSGDINIASIGVHVTSQNAAHGGVRQKLTSGNFSTTQIFFASHKRGMKPLIMQQKISPN
jgi:hypothetical protein